MDMRRWARVVALVMAVGAQGVFAAGPEVGATAGRIEVGEWVSGEIRGAGAFAGKAVILEFWATWCGPCRAILPHMNTLVEKFASDDVVFVSMTDEDREKVAAYMAKFTMKARVAIDKDGATHQSYGIETIPYLYIIDPTGVVRWRDHPGRLSEELLSQYLKSSASQRFPEASAALPTAMPAPIPPAASAGISVMVNRNSGARPFASEIKEEQGQIVIRMTKQPLAQIVATLLEKPMGNVRFDGAVPAYLLDVLCYASPPMSLEQARRKAAEEVCRTLGVTLNNSSDAIVLSTPSSGK
ncbi:MAG: TlpA family protein disulfide reductase [Acidobacteria bacterium]|nr:TlpA family protein disulfide reductase [Acidobacteriota bacterium]